MDDLAQTPRCPFGGHTRSHPEPDPLLDLDFRWEAAALKQHLAHDSKSAPIDKADLRAATRDARTAWRNSLRCIARPRWRSLQILDARQLDNPDEIFEALRSHLRLATNGGDIQSVMTLFRQWDSCENEIRIWNHQLLGYACYRGQDGSWLGDPMNLKLTEIALALGWLPPHDRSAFDPLPLIIQAKGKLRLYTLPTEDIVEVAIRHPDYPKLGELCLKWYAVPAVADMLYASSSALHTAAPFNGHYMATEISARNLVDTYRYNQLPRVAACMGIDPNLKTNPLWKDRAMLTLNEAVLYSFHAAGVRIANHHQASDQFTQFCRTERKHGRTVGGDWTWLVPPVSGSANSVFHQKLQPNIKLPNFFYQSKAWETDYGRALLART